MKNEFAYVAIIVVGLLSLVVGYTTAPNTLPITTSSVGVQANTSGNVTITTSSEGNTGQTKGFATQGYGVYSKIPSK